MSRTQQQSLVDALTGLCERPLSHASIAPALFCGVEGGVPYIAHAKPDGVAVDDYLAAWGPRPLSDVAQRVADLAEVVDLAARHGLHHGALGPRDIAFAPDSAAVSGFGVAQAVRAASLDTNDPSTADDIYALAALAFELLIGRRYEGGDVRAQLRGLRLPAAALEPTCRALEAALSPDPRLWPSTARGFAALLASADNNASYSSGTAPSRETHRADAKIGRLDLGGEESGDMSVRPVAPERETPREPMDLSALEESSLLEFEPEAAVPVPPAAEPSITAAPELRAVERGPRVEPEIVVPVRTGSMFQSEPSVRSSGNRFWIAAGAIVVLGAFALGLVLTEKLGQQASLEQQTSLEQSAATTSTADRPPTSGVARPDEPAPDRPTSASSEPQTGVVAPPSTSPGSAVTPVPDGPVAQDSSASSTSTPVREPVADTKAPEPAFQGRLLIRSTPSGAAVFVDGKSMGVTPLPLRGLALGTHDISVVVPGKPPWERRVTLTRDQPALSFDVGVEGQTQVRPDVSATLEIDSRPTGARVWLNDSLVGTTPVKFSRVRAGSHAIRIELPGYRPWTTAVTVGGGEQRRVRASLER
jgi:hypothetical protein